MDANSEASVNEVNLIAWSLKMKALFFEQVKYREFLWNIKSNLYLRKSTQHAM